jgi:hypothetical protein
LQQRIGRASVELLRHLLPPRLVRPKQGPRKPSAAPKLNALASALGTRTQRGVVAGSEHEGALSDHGRLVELSQAVEKP